MDKTEKFEKGMMYFLDHAIKDIDIVKELLDQGQPASYEDQKGRFIVEYPNGRKFLVEYDPITKKPMMERKFLTKDKQQEL